MVSAFAVFCVSVLSGCVCCVCVCVVAVLCVAFAVFCVCCVCVCFVFCVYSFCWRLCLLRVCFVFACGKTQCQHTSHARSSPASQWLYNSLQCRPLFHMVCTFVVHVRVFTVSPLTSPEVSNRSKTENVFSFFLLITGSECHCECCVCVF